MRYNGCKISDRGFFVMGFLRSLFGIGTIHTHDELKKNEKETQKWNALLQEMMEYESSFNDYLKSVGIIDSYCADVEYVDNGNITSVKREIENLRKKVDDYISLGGIGIGVRNLESLDDDINKVKYLKEIGQLNRQREFANDDSYTVQNKIEAEQKEAECQQQRSKQEINNIIKTDINSLSGVEFEKVCQQLVENMGFETETTKASGDGGIDLIAYNHQPLLSGKYIIQCKRYTGSVGEPIIRDLYGVVTSERANKGILMTTGYFTKSAIAFAEDKPIELIDGNKIQILLRDNNIRIFSSKIIKNKNIELNWKIDNGNSDEVNFYNYHTQLLQEHPNELLYQLTFLEIAVTRLYTEVWCEGNLDLQSIINDFYNVFNSLNVDDLDDNLKYSIIFLNTPVLFLEKKFDELIIKYYELLNWKELINSISELTGLDETYFTVVNNLIQVLLLLGKTDEANDIRSKHNHVIENQLDYFESQIDYDFDYEISERFLKLKKKILLKGIGYFFFFEYSHTSININKGEDKIDFSNHYSHIYRDCIEHHGKFGYESEVFLNEIDIIKNNEQYYLETRDKNILFF